MTTDKAKHTMTTDNTPPTSTPFDTSTYTMKLEHRFQQFEAAMNTWFNHVGAAVSPRVVAHKAAGEFNEVVMRAGMGRDARFQNDLRAMIKERGRSLFHVPLCNNDVDGDGICFQCAPGGCCVSNGGPFIGTGPVRYTP